MKIVKMKNNNFLMIIAIIAVGMALLNLGITINKIRDIKSLTGYATGTLNFTIESAAAVVFITDNIDWGAGRVTEGEDAATIDSEGTMTYGNWTTVTEGFRLNNTGNCNVTFTITSAQNSTDLLGAGSTYKAKLEDNETDACSGSSDFDSYTALDKSAQSGCTNFGWEDNVDFVNIEIEIVISKDAIEGAKSDTLTITANCV